MCHSRDMIDPISGRSDEAIMLDVKAFTTEELRQIAEHIREELSLRQAELQRTCDHPEFIAIMYMRPGATYKGCKVCQKAAPEHP